jgi:hypothetical protein
MAMGGGGGAGSGAGGFGGAVGAKIAGGTPDSTGIAAGSSVRMPNMQEPPKKKPSRSERRYGKSKSKGK